MQSSLCSFAKSLYKKNLSFEILIVKNVTKETYDARDHRQAFMCVCEYVRMYMCVFYIYIYIKLTIKRSLVMAVVVRT